MPHLIREQISLDLKSIPDWKIHGQVIHRTFKFSGFLKALDFVNQIGAQAQKNNHHPDIDIRFDKVTLTLTSHDEGGLTQKDFTLAEESDQIFAKFLSSE